MQTQAKHEREADKVASWRRQQLLDANLPPPLALRVARDPHYDVHALIELVERGCPPEFACRILAPVDEEGDVA